MNNITADFIRGRALISVCFVYILSGCTNNEQTVEQIAGENGQTGHSTAAHSEMKTVHRVIQKPVVPDR